MATLTLPHQPAPTNPTYAPPLLPRIVHIDHVPLQVVVEVQGRLLRRRTGRPRGRLELQQLVLVLHQLPPDFLGGLPLLVGVFRVGWWDGDCGWVGGWWGSNWGSWGDDELFVV